VREKHVAMVHTDFAAAHGQVLLLRSFSKKQNVTIWYYFLGVPGTGST
jgi:hypothetical protein